METIKINLNKPIFMDKEISIDKIYEDGNDLVIFIKDELYKWYYYAKEGDLLKIKRVAYDENDEPSALEENLPIKSIKEKDGEVIIRTYQPSVKSYKVSGITLYSSAQTIDGKSYKKFIFNENLWIFPQDIASMVSASEDNDSYDTYKVYGKNFKGTIIYKGDFFIPVKTSIRSGESGDTYTVSYIPTCDDDIKVMKYAFAPSIFEKNSIVIGDDLSIDDAETLFSFEFNYNPFYYKTNIKDSGMTLCHLWSKSDPWWTDNDSFLNGQVSEGVIKINSGNNRTVITRNTAFWNVDTLLTADTNYTALGTEDLFSETYANEIFDESVPDFIDMERLKYIPVYGDIPLTSITLDFHFRKRASFGNGDDRSENASTTSGNVYVDGWYIKNDEDTWNGMENEGKVSDFIATDRGVKSDAIGYLNFTDNDIFYRKSKVSKTFVRLSFYTSTDPIDQKLLFYSTSFLDTTALYGKYIKQCAYLNSISGKGEYDIDSTHNGFNANANVVFSTDNTVSGALSSEIILTNEYDRTKSSEGFNVYLFADDVVGNEERTIYMKVEFNHAGNGKTLPMIADNVIADLSVSNFFESLYIPVKLRYLNGSYTYQFADEYGKYSERNITLNLFEAKLNQDE